MFKSTNYFELSSISIISVQTMTFQLLLCSLFNLFFTFYGLQINDETVKTCLEVRLSSTTVTNDFEIQITIPSDSTNLCTLQKCCFDGIHENGNVKVLLWFFIKFFYLLSMIMFFFCMTILLVRFWMNSVLYWTRIYLLNMIKLYLHNPEY